MAENFAEYSEVHDGQCDAAVINEVIIAESTTNSELHLKQSRVICDIF
jgi:hypothetical protein